MLKKLIAKSIVDQLFYRDKIKRAKIRKKRKKNKHREQMIEMFGATRYYLAYWFGEWVLFVGMTSPETAAAMQQLPENVISFERYKAARAAR